MNYAYVCRLWSRNERTGVQVLPQQVAQQVGHQKCGVDG